MASNTLAKTAGPLDCSIDDWMGRTGLPKELWQGQYEIKLAQAVIESFVWFLILEIRKYYDGEQGQFAEWQEQDKKHK